METIEPQLFNSFASVCLFYHSLKHMDKALNYTAGWFPTSPNNNGSVESPVIFYVGKFLLHFLELMLLIIREFIFLQREIFSDGKKVCTWNGVLVNGRLRIQSVEVNFNRLVTATLGCLSQVLWAIEYFLVKDRKGWPNFLRRIQVRFYHSTRSLDSPPSRCSKPQLSD